MKGSEELILYADVLFAINFSMDFLALFICSIILHKKLLRKRIVIAALLGGLFGVFEVILPINQILSILLSVLVAFFMCLIAFFEKSAKRIIITNLMYWGVSAGLGGVMSLLYSILNKLLAEVIANYSQTTAYNGARFFIIAAITAIVSIIFSRIFTSKKDVSSTEITVRLDEIDFKMNALCDSGNMLCDPILSKPVILVSCESKIGKIITSKEDKRKRFIPYSDVSSSGILKGIIPEMVKIGDNIVDAVIAPIEKKDFAGYEALVPSKLL
ncbi:MAG: sigma-E processing peptidase SpoIIGA [Clostridia bacterium]|nr:sigma-E processing peptidase SpoIIGA [Clostridia bacterium]